MTKTKHFDRFVLNLLPGAVADCSGSGSRDSQVAMWTPTVRLLNPQVTTDAIRATLAEYGAWSDEELEDTDACWQRIVWIAACDLAEDAES